MFGYMTPWKVHSPVQKSVRHTQVYGRTIIYRKQNDHMIHFLWE